LLLQHFGPYDDVDVASLVFNRNEDDALSRFRSLTHSDECRSRVRADRSDRSATLRPASICWRAVVAATVPADVVPVSAPWTGSPQRCHPLRRGTQRWCFVFNFRDREHVFVGHGGDRLPQRFAPIAGKRRKRVRRGEHLRAGAFYNSLFARDSMVAPVNVPRPAIWGYRGKGRGVPIRPKRSCS